MQNKCRRLWLRGASGVGFLSIRDVFSLLVFFMEGFFVCLFLFVSLCYGLQW